jgi:hypothetical protein
MIPNVRFGSIAYGLVAYLLGPGKENEHKNQHLITGSKIFKDLKNAMGDEIRSYQEGALEKMSPKQIQRVFDRHTNLYLGKVEDTVAHISLSLSPEDGILSDKKWAEIAESFVDKLNLHNSSRRRVERDWFVIRHGLSKNGNDHVHLAINLIDAEGKYIKDVGQGKRVGLLPVSQNVARKLEDEFGLIKLESSQHELRKTKGYEIYDIQLLAQMKARAAWNYAEMKDGGRLFWTKLSKKEQEELTESYKGDHQPQLETMLKVFQVQGARNEFEFIKLLKMNGLAVRPRYASGVKVEEGLEKHITGYAVSPLNDLGNPTIWYSGNNLDKELSLKALREKWKKEAQLVMDYQKKHNMKIVDQSQVDDAKTIKAWRVVKNKNPVFEKQRHSKKVSANLGRVTLGPIRSALLRFSRIMQRQYIAQDYFSLNSALSSMSDLFFFWSARCEPRQPGYLALTGYDLKCLEDEMWLRNLGTNQGSYKVLYQSAHMELFGPKNELSLALLNRYNPDANLMVDLVFGLVEILCSYRRDEVYSKRWDKIQNHIKESKKLVSTNVFPPESIPKNAQNEQLFTNFLQKRIEIVS